MQPRTSCLKFFVVIFCDFDELVMNKVNAIIAEHDSRIGSRRVEEEVRQLDVTMADFEGVDVRDALGHVAGPMHDPRERDTVHLVVVQHLRIPVASPKHDVDIPLRVEKFDHKHDVLVLASIQN